MVNDSFEAEIRRFCWVDLASADEQAARSFYGRLFGWAVQERRAGQGRFAIFAHRDAPFASLYQLSQKQIGSGVPSHWTPYVSVPDVDATAALVSGLGGQVVVQPHDVADLARVGLVCDPTGALIGLWQGMRQSNGRQPQADR